VVTRLWAVAAILVWTLAAADHVHRLTKSANDYFLHGQYLEALAAYEEAVQRGGGPMVLINLGRLYEQLGDDGRALHSYDRAMTANPSPELLISLGGFYRRTGEPVKALEKFRSAGDWESAGTVQALDLHDLEGALVSFSQLRDAHLLRGEVLFRLERWDAAEQEFRSAGNHWLALYGLGCIELQRGHGDQAVVDFSQAIATMAGAPEPTSDLLPRKSSVFDDMIRLQPAAAPETLFDWMEGALRNGGDRPALREIQTKLAPGSMLVEHWDTAAVWATRERAGIGDPVETGLPSAIRNLLIVPAGGLNSPELPPVRYLPYAGLLLHEESSRMPLLPWQKRVVKIQHKIDLTTGAPVVSFSAAVADVGNPNRSRIVFSPSEALFRAEAAELPLGKTDLVTIDACETAGASILGEAFLAAGARSVVVPLRPVDAQTGAAFMQHFYVNLAKGQPTATALRNTKLERREWEAFILMGNGELPIRGVLSWWWIVAAAAVGGRIGLSIIRLPRRAN
jgi:hypothetical protein